MFSQAQFPSELLSPHELDSYLSKGWFRTGQSIFTCTYIYLNNQVYRVFWLRVMLGKFTIDKTFQKLSKLNSKFNIKIQQASITPEKEELYEIYKSGISFEPSESLKTLLDGIGESNIFNSLEICLYDGEKLIAVGYFDVGNNSAEGISCFYDPAYKKYSLGKYLIYQKMLYCKNQNMKYFYQGYFAPGCKAFDYKLDIAKKALEYFDIGSQKWCEINTWDPVKGSIEENRQKLVELQQELSHLNIENHLFRYSYFQANMYKQFQGYGMFDYLMFVNCFHFNPEIVNPIIVYDVRDEHYYLLKCISLGRPEEIKEQAEEYSANVLKIIAIIYSTPNAKELAKMIEGAWLLSTGTIPNAN